MSNPLTRSLAKLRSEGWLAEKVERPWNQFSKVRSDLFGYGDILAVRDEIVLIVQSTTGSNAAARVAKIASIPAAHIWMRSPYRQIMVHSWAKRGDKGKRKRWTCVEVPIEITITETIV